MIVLVLILFLGFANINYGDSDADAIENERQSEEIGKLVLQRADVMNRYFYGELEYFEAANLLSDVETGTLLEEDISNLELYTYTDIDNIEGCEISDIFLLEPRDNQIIARVTVKWIVSGIEGREKFSVIYYAVCEKDGETLKLVEFF
jgi:hypothetical protein